MNNTTSKSAFPPTDTSIPAEPAEPARARLAQVLATNPKPVKARKASRGLHKAPPAQDASSAELPQELEDFREEASRYEDAYLGDAARRAQNSMRCAINPKTGLLELAQHVVHSDGSISKEYPRLTDGFVVADASTGATRVYRGVQWHPELRRQADEYGHSIWMQSLDAVSELADGLWVKEISLAWQNGDKPSEGDGNKKGGGGGGKPPTWTQITTTPVFVSGIVVDERQSHFVEFSFYRTHPTESQWEKVLIGFDQLQDEGTGSIWKELSRRGLMLSNKKSTQRFRQMAADYYAMAGSDPAKYMQTGRARPGWHELNVDGESQLAYLTAGFTTTETVRYTGPQGMPWEKMGDEDAYMRRMAQMLKANPVVALTCGFNAAGLLISFFSQLDHNPIWAHLGESSIGKTLAAETALSMRGRPVTFLKNMDATENAIKSRMRGFNHTGGAVDEIGSAGDRNVKDKLANIYQWASGLARGRTRANALTGEYDEKVENDRYYYTLLLTGEEAFVDMSASNAGNKVRLAQNVFNAGNPLWHSIKNKEEAEEWRGFFNKNYGFLYPKLVTWICKKLPRYQDAYDEFSRRLSEATSSQQQGRKSNAWALAMVGVLLLADELRTVFDEAGETMEGFTHDDVNVVFEHATRLMKLEMDSMPIEKESDKYEAHLEGLPTYYAADLFRYSGGNLDFEPNGNPKGMYTYTKHQGKNGAGLSVTHELCVISNYLDGMCFGKVDKTRFLRWAKETGRLHVTTETREGTVIERNTTKVTITKGQSTVYKFTWTEKLTDDVDFNTPSAQE